jgi:hypothetical protein
MKKYPKIEFDPWIHTQCPDKPGYVELTSMVTFRQLQNELEAFLKKSPVLDLTYGDCMHDYFDYILFSSGYNVTKPKFVADDQLPLKTRVIGASGSRGGSEGWYFHLDIVYTDDKGDCQHDTCITLKTLTTDRERIHEIYEVLNEFSMQIN